MFDKSIRSTGGPHAFVNKIDVVSNFIFILAYEYIILFCSFILSFYYSFCRLKDERRTTLLSRLQPTCSLNHDQCIFSTPTNPFSQPRPTCFCNPDKLIFLTPNNAFSQPRPTHFRFSWPQPMYFRNPRTPTDFSQ